MFHHIKATALRSFLALAAFALIGAPSAHAAGTTINTVLQGQSNAYLMADGYNGYQYWATFQPMLKALTGSPTVNAYANTDASQPHGASIFSGTPTYDSTANGGAGDAGLWLNANSTNPATWPLGANGQSVYNYVQYNLSGKTPAGVPVAFLRIHSEYDTKKNGTDASYYPAANHRFVDLMRQAAGLSATQMPVFYGSPDFWNGVSDTGLSTVRSAWLSEINTASNNAHWAWGCVSDANDMGDASHMDALGDQQACARMAVRVARWMYDHGYSANDLSALPGLGPRIIRFDRVTGAANQIQLTIQHDKGTDLVIPSGVALAGFEITNGTRALTATTAQRVDATHLKLTLNGNLDSNPVTLDYLRLNGFYGPNSLITDNWHTLTKPTVIQNAVTTYFAGLKMPLRRLEKPLSVGLTDAGSLDDVPVQAGPPIGHRIALYSPVSGKYVTANHNNYDLLNASWASSIGQWETFDVYDAGSGNIALLSEVSGKFVSCNLNNSSFLQASFATTIGTWERFGWQPQSDGSIALFSNGSGYYVTNDHTNGDQLKASWASSVLDWEEFNWTDLGTY